LPDRPGERSNKKVSNALARSWPDILTAPSGVKREP